MSRKNSGYLVKTKDGKLGRTYHSKEMVNGKLPVYLASKIKKVELKPGVFMDFPVEFSETAILLDPKTLESQGLID